MATRTDKQGKPKVKQATPQASIATSADTIMNMNPIGKFEMRDIVREFESTLIRLYGVNMLDAAISRYEALDIYNEFRCPRTAAAICGLRKGLNLQAA